MRLNRLPFVFLVACVLAAAPLGAAEVTRSLRIELPADLSGEFAVENLAGTMRVVRGAGSSVVAVATVHAEDSDLAEEVTFERVSGDLSSGPTLRVRYPLDEHRRIHYPGEKRGLERLLDWGSGSSSQVEYDGHRVKVSSAGGVMMYADVEVQVPSGQVEAAFRNVVGRMYAEGIEGDLSFDTASGDVKIDRLNGTVDVDTGSGDVKVTDSEGSLICDTGSGDIEVIDFDGERVECDVGSGDVTIRSGSITKIDLDTGSGDVWIVDVDLEEFAADTGSGDVDLETAGDRLALVDADTGSGDVTLRLGPDASFEAHADQGSGDIVCRYSDAHAIVEGRTVVGYRRGGGRIRIDVDTGSGDLVIKPGGASARY